ncbi:strawberry notch-like NTP hydrolase domain-containing protein [Methylotuvimicrobium alcaliphilum]|uniref:DNA primase traC (Modular protein) n=1 Tax=Methylotuvimicrobium alcaliphilum (strain DSM 19304 / NCIMB 14124 / VKM B-2133 / 20Z) TaxID=1091494 RepID=G4T4P4_META2|nr:strawberry notch family protein [Methylotuvimicrobium alcaliphilum]CCE25800.1 DNA primase traC (modular protein) [Methylotuvimicrobium alcaliphilum 20Z]
MEEFQQFSTPPALSFVANWVANVKPYDVMGEPSAGTGDLAIWSKIAGAEIVLNELSPRRQALLSSLFPKARLFKENAEQLDNVLPPDIKPTVIVMNPPFSSTAGRVRGQRDTSNGARHIEQALKRLQDGGRLVAVVGNGMAADRPAFANWWKEIEKKYTVRANVGIAGKEYAKYGTTFDNQLLVIDKTEPTTQPVLTGSVDSVADLPTLLEGIRNDRQHLQRGFNQPAIDEDTPTVPDSLQPSDGARGISSDTGSSRAESIGHGGGSGASATDSQAGGESAVSDVVNDGIGAGSGISNGTGGNAGGSGGADIGGNSGISESNPVGAVAIEVKSGEVSEFTDSVFASYSPQRLTIPGAKPHPGKLVQSAAMSAVQPLTPTYAPVLPVNVIQDGLLSIAQLESIVYAGQAHSELLPNGSRKGFFIGDGTGVGKGREISGIILDNLMQGRSKAVWVSFNEGLIEDARRDFAGVGGDPSKIFFQGKTKAGNEITQKYGILFTTYSTLRGGEKKLANDLGQKGGKTRAQQIIDWLGKDFDGVIAFDEAHSMGNAIAVKGKRGVKKPSQQAIAGINLQKALPNARVTYVSATGATEISNLSYADRLGLWGEGTPFADTTAFIDNVSKGGIASMELISRDMKAMGMYLARSLSYDGVSYERLEHTLSDLQEDIYNELAGAWQVVLDNVDQALEITQAGKSGAGKSAAMSQFWGAHQRFFNQIITAMQTPRVIDDIREQLDAGHVAVIQLVNTNEASQERIIADAAANDAALEDLDFTPRQMLMDYVRNGFPVAAYEESQDSNGNTVYIPVRDAEGNQVFDREAIALRDALLETLHQIRVPENPLDSIINAFGSDTVAEVTGRSRRFVQVRDEEGNLRVVEEKRGKNASRADAEAFQNNKKDILVFSGAGGTGYSFHADNTAENQRKRIHYILQPGWRADSAVQGFGRTHRTNQAQEPHYVLPTTNLKAQKRFVSSIARRLDQLGALTRGQREATGQGMFTASDNLESEYASTALKNFFSDLYRGQTGLSFHEVTKQMGLNLLDENLSLSESKIPAIPQFLNRLLSLKTDMQNAVFGEFEDRLIEAVEYAKQRGLYDVGLQTMTALSIVKTRDDVAYEDKNTGAQTRYVELAVTNEIQYNAWEDAKKLVRENPRDNDISGWFVAEFGKNKGDVFFLSDIGERLNSEGKTVHRGVVHTIRKNDHRYIDNADAISRGYDYRSVVTNGVGSYQKVTLTRAIDEKEAERLWNEQLANAPKTETKTERMIVGVILPIWDRVEGSETIKRLQTDDGEQLLGRMLGPKAAKQTLKNLGLDSGLSTMSASDLFNSIKNGNKAILSNGWEIATAKVNREDRIEIKGRGYLTDAEKRLLKEQGAFVERISWVDRVFIPTGSDGVGVFERITASKPVVDLIKKSRNKENDEVEQEHGIPKVINESAIHPVNSEPAVIAKDVSNTADVHSQSGGISMNQKKPFHETVAENLIKQLEAGTAPWQRPWEAGASGSFLPYNPTTGNRYKGINALHLMAQDRVDQRWLTYNQAAAEGAQVRKGEKGTGIQYWKFTEEQTKKDEYGKPVLDAEGKPVKVIVKLERPRVFFATVFNGEQIDGLPELEKKEQTWDPIERAENILNTSGANIQHNGGERAFYRSLTDSIHLPDKGLFSSADRYYSTALHELGHWTGHSSRLDRDLAHPFGSEGYAKEELRAEISSMILGDELGIGHDPGQHAAYVGSWIKALKEDPLEIFRAAADAEKIQGYILGLEQQHIQEQEKAQTHTATLADLTTKEYQRMQAAEENYHQELVRVYGEPSANEARYQLSHEDPIVQASKEAFLAASEAWHNAINDARKSIDGGNISQANEDKAMTEYQDELARLLKLSTLTPRLSAEARSESFSKREWLDEIVSMEPPETNSKEFILASDQFTFWNGDGWRGLDEAKRYNDPTTAFKDALSLDESERDYLEESAVMLYEHDHNVKTFNLTVTTALMSNKPALRDRWIKHFGEACPEDVLAAKTERSNTENITQGDTDSTSDSRTYINVPYQEKDDAKKLGARWDRQERSWFIPPGVDPEPFANWTTHKSNDSVDRPIDYEPVSPVKNDKREYLAVPYGERNAAKAAGALWDKVAKSWYVGPNAQRDELERWKPDNVPNQQSPAISPMEEFADAMRSIDFIVADGHPIMDGKKHRIEVGGDKTGEKSGFYVGHLDGHPAGYIKNNRTGIDMKWKSKGYLLDPQEKAKLQAEAAEKLAARAAEQERVHEATAQRVSRQTANLVPVFEPTPYLRDKGIQAHAGTLTDAGGQKTYIPATDVDGKQWTMQYIQEDGTKRFAKDSRKEGCFHVIGGIESLDQAPALVISEGYATAATNAEALGFATVAAFDSGNLPVVAKALHEKFPDKPVIIAGDDDRNRLLTDSINPGRSKAEEAAKAVNGTAIFPIFAPGENVYPPNLESFTPQQYREHDRAMRRLEAAQKEPETVKLSNQEVIKLQNALLSSEQIDALDKMKAHTDFNDLATRSQLGRNGLERQVRAALSQALQDNVQREKQEQTKEQKRAQEQRPKRTACIG